ncbi:trehalose-6-phosphate synthase [Halococcus dombrowskii]|uniref:Trehalose-6-phosphate synthase n=1 Tax=Halococcus dombrowskii TaxID=179637 RepID=A0AAV3SD78_HALDO|nr:trehalose-6-phosphate synthase [Halococcus dombrowskii]UOO96147.1 trehalose-6-phosphate synthase [Halococcus dombrowskii]
MGVDNSATDDGIVPAVDDGELIVVSNRQPYTHSYDHGDGGRSITVNRPAGGLTAGLDPVMQETDGTWIAWGDGEADADVTDDNGTVRMPPESEAYTLKRLWLTDEEVEGYYYGYSNRVLWPLCHGGTMKTDYVERYWQRYQQVNETFADAVVETAGADSLIWFQDYHFTLAPRWVRDSLPDSAFLTHFWHITWPGWDTFRACPQHEQLLEGLLGNDLLGFHVERYCRNFLDCVDEALDDAFIDPEGGRVNYEGHTTVVKAFPMGIDADSIREHAEAADDDFWREFQSSHGIDAETSVIVGVDRLDYTKGIVERLDALERLLETRPEYRGEVCYVQKANESRSLIPDYQDLQTEVQESIDRINERFGTDDWQPVIYINEFIPQRELCGLYRYADVMLVSAVRDGMNLVSKEYVAAQVDDDGVLVLSDQAGAHEELGDRALTINPYDTDAFADTIERALTMDGEERAERMVALRERVESNDLYAWMEGIFDTIDELRAKDADDD